MVRQDYLFMMVLLITLMLTTYWGKRTPPQALRIGELTAHLPMVVELELRLL
jgi:hypothetical protein